MVFFNGFSYFRALCVSLFLFLSLLVSCVLWCSSMFVTFFLCFRPPQTLFHLVSLEFLLFKPCSPSGNSHPEKHRSSVLTRKERTSRFSPSPLNKKSFSRKLGEEQQGEDRLPTEKVSNDIPKKSSNTLAQLNPKFSKAAETKKMPIELLF